MKKYEVKRLKKAFQRNANLHGTKGKGSVTFYNIMRKLTWRQKKHIIQYILKKIKGVVKDDLWKLLG